ncbi:hypothetical protein NXW38_25105 [Bacteroides ovatus]|nr:hypothetical protein [Bacteroides ovatus]MCS2813301.1 hypothetical protein [Bacteroides ovatus]MCS3102172.1 hypothetical protein [Bacteroides ovatus]
MITKEFLQYTGFCAPIISSLGCAIMLVLFRHTHAKSEEGTLHRLLVSYFLLVSLGWICSLVYVYLPLLYVRINILYYLIVFWSQVVFYQFIYTLTRLPGEKPFSRIHYIFPLVIVGTFAVWSAFVPFETQVYIVTSRGEVAPGYEAYSRFFTARLLLRGIWNIAYTALAWWRLLAYRRSISDYSANADRTSLAWVTLLLLISFSLVPPSLLSYHFLQKDTDSVAVAADSPIVAGSAARCGLLQYGCREFRGYLLSGRRNRNRIKGRCRNGNGKRN